MKQEKIFVGCRYEPRRIDLRHSFIDKRCTLRLLLLASLLSVVSVPGICQVDSSKASPKDSTRIVSSTQTQATQTIEGYHSTKDPWLALGISAGVPGSGQIYNRDYWKVPVVWGLGAYWISQWIANNKQYKNYQAQYLQTLLANPSSEGDPQLMAERDFYRNERDDFAWYMGILYFANIIDAYVSARLYDFDVSPDLSNKGAKISFKIGLN